jgi:hypothetical protein
MPLFYSQNKAISPTYLKLHRKLLIIMIIIYLSCSRPTCWPVPVSRIQKSLQRSAMIPSASWGIVFHYPGQSITRHSVYILLAIGKNAVFCRNTGTVEENTWLKLTLPEFRRAYRVMSLSGAPDKCLLGENRVLCMYKGHSEDNEGVEDMELSGYDVVSMSLYFPKFQRKETPSSSRVKESKMTLCPLKMKVLLSLQMSGNSNPETRCRIPEVL